MLSIKPTIRRIPDGLAWPTRPTCDASPVARQSRTIPSKSAAPSKESAIEDLLSAVMLCLLAGVVAAGTAAMAIDVLGQVAEASSFDLLRMFAGPR